MLEPSNQWVIWLVCSLSDSSHFKSTIIYIMLFLLDWTMLISYLEPTMIWRTPCKSWLLSRMDHSWISSWGNISRSWKIAETFHPICNSPCPVRGWGCGSGRGRWTAPSASTTTCWTSPACWSRWPSGYWCPGQRAALDCLLVSFEEDQWNLFRTLATKFFGMVFLPFHNLGSLNCCRYHQ